VQSADDVVPRGPPASSTAASSAGDGERDDDDGPDGAFEALARTAGLRQAARDAARTLDATLAELEAHSTDSEHLIRSPRCVTCLASASSPKGIIMSFRVRYTAEESNPSEALLC